MSDAQTADEASRKAALESKIAALLRRLPGALEAAGCRPLSGGAMQEMWMVAAKAKGGDGATAQRLFVLRRLIGAAETRSDFALDLEKEAELLRAAARCGVPSPEVAHVLTPEDGLGRGYLMSHVPGETIPQKIFKTEALIPALDGLAAQCGAALARIHAMPLDGLEFLQAFTPKSHLAMLRENYELTGPPRPVYEYAFRWLDERVGAMPARQALIHGDFRFGNLMIDSGGVAAVLDWELAHICDPIEDLGWLCTPSWRFGRIEKPVGGFGDIEDLRAGYVEAGGAPFDDEQLLFWIVYGALFWGVTCRGFAKGFVAGEKIVERGVIGRRASEVEIDLLCLLDPRGVRLC